MIEEDGQPEILNVGALSNQTFRSTSCTKWYKKKALDCTQKNHSNCQPHVHPYDNVSNEDVIGYLACIGNRDEWRLPFRRAFIEYLFSTGLTDIVKNEAIRQIKEVFGSSTVPKNIITVHLRWGNKGLEAPLLGIEAYRKGIESLVNKKNTGEIINIYLATEDPRGLPALKAELEKTSAEDTESIWFKNGFKIYLDAQIAINIKNGLRPLTAGPSAVKINSGTESEVARLSKGKYGLQGLASLMIAMEADRYVLTLSSNFSRLMNEIRINMGQLAHICGWVGAWRTPYKKTNLSSNKGPKSS